MNDSTERRHRTANQAADPWITTPRQAAVIRQRLGKVHADSRAERRGDTDQNASQLFLAAKAADAASSGARRQQGQQNIVDILFHWRRAPRVRHVEPGLWGLYRRQTEAARAELLASEWGQRSVRATLIQDVALAYFNLRALDAQRSITERTIQARKESLQLTQALEEQGAGSLADVRQAEELLRTAQANLPELQREIGEVPALKIQENEEMRSKCYDKKLRMIDDSLISCSEPATGPSPKLQSGESGSGATLPSRSYCSSLLSFPRFEVEAWAGFQNLSPLAGGNSGSTCLVFKRDSNPDFSSAASMWN